MSRIINTSTSSEEGTHWVAIYAPNNTHVVYLDSYGEAPDAMILREGDTTPFREMLAKVAPNVIYQNVGLQDSRTFVCGYYCIYFLYMMHRQLGHSNLVGEGAIKQALREARRHLFSDLQLATRRDKAVVAWVTANFGKPV